MIRHQLTQTQNGHAAGTEVALLSSTPNGARWTVRVLGAPIILQDVPVTALGVIEEAPRPVRAPGVERKPRPAMPMPEPKETRKEDAHKVTP